MSTGTLILIILVALGIAVWWRAVLLAVVTCVIALLLVGAVAVSHLDQGECPAPAPPASTERLR